MISLLFQNRFIIGYLKIIAQLIIVVDLQINQCKVSINLLGFSLLTKVQSQLKVRTFRLSTVNSTKVQSQSNFTMPNHVYSFISSPNNKKNKEINWSNLRIQLRNYNGINLRSLELHECKIKIEEWIERKETKLGHPKGPKTPKSQASSLLLLPLSLYIGFGLGFSVGETSQISFKIKIKINIQRYLERSRLFNKYSLVNNLWYN